MDLKDVMSELESYGSDSTKNTFIRHGAKEPLFGVKVQDLKKIVKKIKKNHDLSMALYKTGNSDAMYLAGLIADEKKISKEDLREWVKGAYWYYISEFIVPWVAADSGHGFDLGKEWIEHEEETIAAAGWAALSNYLLVTPNESIDKEYYASLMERVEKTIHQAKNRVRYAMNGFIIMTGSQIPEFTEQAKQIGKRIGKVDVNVGDTACKVPFSPDYIDKVAARGSIGKKKKTSRC